MTSIEICAGGGGQALGLEAAGFDHTAVVEIEPIACETLRANRPDWNVIEADVRDFSALPYRGVDLLAGGVPCPPFSIAGKQLGADDERDLFPHALRLVAEANPRAVLLENVRGLSQPRFAEYRAAIIQELERMGYVADWRLLKSCDFGVPQLRPRFVLVALKAEYAKGYSWPQVQAEPLTVGQALVDLMGASGWEGVSTWVQRANGIAPTIVGGSKKHGGPDLGPSRARAQWKELGVNGGSIASEPPTSEQPVDHLPRLTIPMVARLQVFPDSWKFSGKKTAAYRQVGNAFPPPVAAAIASQIARALCEQG